jgi:BTB/POZ domain-containing protein KCTD9
MRKIARHIQGIILSPVRSAFLVFAVFSAAVVIVTGFWDFFRSLAFTETQWGLYNEDFWKNVLVEAHGTILDLVLVGIIILYLDHRRNTRASIAHYQEDIDDFRYWMAQEAAYKTVGNIRRLNSLGKTDINLSDCYLKAMNLSGMNLSGANLRGAKLEAVSLKRALLPKAKLEGSVLEGACLRGCNLSGSNIERANCKNGDFAGACFRHARMWRTDFTNANLRSADLRDANLKDVNFEGADLRSANLVGARNLTLDQLLAAKSIQYAKVDTEFRDLIQKEEPVGGI